MNFSLTINLGEATLGLLTRLCDSLDGLVSATNEVRETGRVSMSVDTSIRPVQIPGTHAGVTPPPGPSAAEVFGGNVAPSGVAAAPSPSAPAAPMAGVQIPVFGAQPPAASAPALAAAPSAPAAATNPAGGVELDTDGLPWDARIHGSTKTKNADGRWRAKKGLNDAALVERVKAELRAVMDAPAPTPPAQHAAQVFAGTAPPAPPAGPSAAEVFGGNAPTPTPASPAAVPGAPIPAAPVPNAMGKAPTPVPASGTPAADPTTMPELMTRLTPHNIPPAKVAAACQMFQLPSVTALMQRPDLVPYVWQALREEFPQLA